MNKQFKLKDSHPTMQKVNQLYALAEELGISMEFYSSGRCLVHDVERPGIDFYMEDVESPDCHVSGFPHPTEFKIVYNKDVE